METGRWGPRDELILNGRDDGEPGGPGFGGIGVGDQEGEVQVPVPQFDPGIIGIELACPDMDFGMAQGEVFDDAGHQASRHRAEHAHGQFDCQCVADLLDRTLRVAFRGQQYLGVFEEDPAYFGQDDAPAPALKYRSPDVLLHGSHLLRDA